MCNYYHTPTPQQLAREALLLGLTAFPEAPPAYPSIVTPRVLAPYFTRQELVIGQWGMIPPGSPSRIPKAASGVPLSTNNARIERVASAWTYRGAWHSGARCLIPAASFDEPNYESGKNVWFRIAPAGVETWLLAGLYSTWVDPATREVVPNFTMLTQNCDGHPMLTRFHKPRAGAAPDAQDKRTVVPIELKDAQTWLAGTQRQALALIRPWPAERFQAAPRQAP